MALRESTELAVKRWELLRLLQDHYSSFEVFLRDAMQHLGFDCTALQLDIAQYMERGPSNLMIQAQRGQAKTTIAACFSIWSIIHNPATRVLIFSAGGDMSKQISTSIVRLIYAMDVLDCLRPDITAGDRSSVEAFDVHHSLKGLERSPSVKCISMGSHMAGNRADIILADDIESMKNALTATQRGQLLQLTQEFTSICSRGRIIWLGTPQTQDSIYNALPGRGVDIRVWPGRYPTPQQVEYYGKTLAPYIANKLELDPSLGTGGGLLRDQGQPTDPALFNEATLQSKEVGQEAHFQLQHMLNTSQLDKLRHPLKLNQLIIAGTVRDGNKKLAAPVTIMRSSDIKDRVRKTVGTYSFELSGLHSASEQVLPFQSVVAYVDPAGGGANADETAYAVVGFLNSNLYLLSIGGVPGGYSPDKLELLAQRLSRFALNRLIIEKNMGHGAFSAVFTPIFKKEYAVKQPTQPCSIEDDLTGGQKELRIIKTLEPIIGRGSLVVTPEALDEDADTLAMHPIGKRETYSLFYQLAKITPQRGALVHDDRADALEGACKQFTEQLALDQKQLIEQQQRDQHMANMRDPLMKNRYKPPSTGTNLFTKYLKRF